MKKIMFNDKCGLTQAVIDEIKTQTRRAICGSSNFEFLSESYDENGKKLFGFKWGKSYISYKPKYQVGEIIAIAQPYSTITENNMNEEYKGTAGYNNKMFVSAELMPHKIMITDVSVERINEISDEDCLSEGISFDNSTDTANHYYYYLNGYKQSLGTPQGAYKHLLDNIGYGDCWLDDEYVFVYKFKLVE